MYATDDFNNGQAQVTKEISRSTEGVAIKCFILESIRKLLQ